MKKALQMMAGFFAVLLLVSVIDCGSGGDGDGENGINHSGIVTVALNNNSYVLGDLVTGSFNVQDADSNNFAVAFTTAASPSGVSLLPVFLAPRARMSGGETEWPVNKLIQKYEDPLFWGFIPSEAGVYRFEGFVSDGVGGQTDFMFDKFITEFFVICELIGEGAGADFILKIITPSTSSAKFNIYWVKGDVPEGQITVGDLVQEGYSSKEYNLGRLLEGQVYTCLIKAYNNPAQFDEQLSATFYKTFTTPTFNRPPIVELGDPFEIQVGKTITLEATEARDPDGDAFTYLWESAAGGTFNNATLATPQFIANTVGTCTVKLTLTDAKGAIASDTGIITVTPAPVVLKWVKVAGLPFSNSRVWQITQDLSDPNIHWVTTDPNSLYKVVNGEVVTKILDGNIYGFDISQKDPNRMVACAWGGNVYTTGNSWGTNLDIGNGYYYTADVLFLPGDPNVIIASTKLGIHRYADSNWSEVCATVSSLHNSIVGDANSIEVGTQTGVKKSVDKGLTFTDHNNGLGSDTNNISAIVRKGDTTYAGTETGNLYKSVAGVWVKIGAGLQGHPVKDIYYKSATELYVLTWQGGVWKSTDGGANFTAFNNGLTGNALECWTMSSTKDGKLLIGTSDGPYLLE